MKNLKNSDISIEDIPSDVFICRLVDDAFIIIDSNEAALRSMARPKEEVVGSDILELIEEIKESNFIDILHEAHASSRSINFDIPCFIHDNLCRWHKGSVKRLFNGDLILYYKNIEREKELEFEELQYQLELISEAPYVGLCIFNEEHFLYANKVLQNMLGYSFEELKQSTPLELLDTENVEEYRSNLSKRVEGNRFTTAYIDTKIKRKDSREICARFCVQTIDYRGKHAALASVIDITKIVAQEQRTKRLSQALEQTDDLLLITDVQGYIHSVNKRFIDKFGYEEQELIGQQPNILKSGKHSRRFYKRLWETLLSGKIYKNTLINKTKKGKFVYLETTITPVFDRSGVIESFVSTAKDVSYQVKTKRRLKKLAMVDTLTKTLNRYAIDKEIDYSISVAQRYSMPFSVLMIDVDYFKKINDSYGHHVGDVVLKNTSDMLRENIRKIDKLGRWGGEEFIIIMHASEKETASNKAEELRQLIEKNCVKGMYNITVSIGVTSYDEDDTRSTLFARVDDALYRAKEEGRNRVVVL